MDSVRGLGRAIFAAVLLLIGGVLNIIYGIAAISNAKFFVGHKTYVFGDLKTWGWITLILGVIELLAAASLFGGGGFGRWFGIFAASLVAIESLLEIRIVPVPEHRDLRPGAVDHPRAVDLRGARGDRRGGGAPVVGSRSGRRDGARREPGPGRLNASGQAMLVGRRARDLTRTR